MNDFDFATGGDSQVDPAYMELLGTGLDDVDEPDREVGYDPVPRFDMYHVKFQGAGSGFSKDKGTPYVRPTAVVVNGPQGTVGRIISDDIYLRVSDTIREKDKTTGEVTERPRTPDEREKAVDEIRKTLKRIAVRLKLDRPVPPSLSEEGLKAYAVGFTDKEAILAIRVEKARGDYPARNRIIWRSIAAPNDPPSKGTDKYATAREESQALIDKWNAKPPTGGSRTAGGLRAAKATEFI